LEFKDGEVLPTLRTFVTLLSQMNFTEFLVKPSHKNIKIQIKNSQRTLNLKNKSIACIQNPSTPLPTAHFTAHFQKQRVFSSLKIPFNYLININL
jgi:hypothetical protein